MHARRFIAGVPGVLVVAASAAACYSTGDGTAPPLDQLYYPVGLQVSAGGSVLYAVNSDFDLQYNGGTLQSYDLRTVRRHVAQVIAKDPTGIPFVRPVDLNECPSDAPVFREGSEGIRQTLGETCAPPVDSRFYVRDTAVVGAFATDLVLSKPPSLLVPQVPGRQDVRAGSRSVDRLFSPVRGNATLTWAQVERDSFDQVPPENPGEPYGPFRIACGQDGERRCDAAHQVGEDPDEPGNTRHITMPGEPFGMTISEDGESILVTHQNETKTSMFSTGLSRSDDDNATPVPAIKFVLDRVPIGGVGVAPIPHDREAFGAGPLPQPAFFQTSRAVAEVSLIRAYSDDGSSLNRAFLNLERAFPITAAAGGADSRQIVIDPTPRITCKARVLPADPAAGRTAADEERDRQACARKPARAFIANRTPAALLIGDVGVTQGSDGAYDPDRLFLHTSIPLAAGPSRIYLAPIVDRDGAYSLRVFVVCFDASSLFVIDPDTGALENVIRVAPGPFAMAFDPFTLEEAAVRAPVPFDTVRYPQDANMRRYRFAYLASFTQSFIQVIDLDDARPNPETFERIVFTLGTPTNPKGS